MNLKTRWLVLLLFVVASNGLEAAGWKLVWADEFNYTGLPDTNKWGYETGFRRNQESQYYTCARPENARVEDGHLVIECRKENYTPPNHAPVDYTAASLITKNKASWQYGRIEVRAKLPHGQGVWPAIWMLGTNDSQVGWPRCGEIDIMEFVGKAPKGIHGTVHYAIDGENKSSGSKLETNRPWEDYHIYALEWTPKRMDFYFDHHKYHSFAVAKADQGADNPFRAPQYLILNFALGGDWGGPIDDTILPQQFLIDYVRIYQSAEHK